MKEEQFLYFPKINGSKNRDENLIHDKDCKFRGLGKWVFDFKEIGKVTVGASFSIPNEYKHLTFCLNSNIEDNQMKRVISAIKRFDSNSP